MNQNQNLHVAIGIATTGRREQLRRTVHQLARLSPLPERVILCPAVADDFDPDLQDLLPCPLEIVSAPRGLCAQRNAILQAAQACDLLVFLDDDYYPARDYLAQAAAVFGAHRDVVIATNLPLLDGATGPGVSHEEALGIVEALGPASAPPKLEDTYGGYGCNMTFRMAPVREHGLRFDENLPLYGWLEDVDFSRRLVRHGRAVRCSALRGVHLGTKGGRTSGVRLGYSQIANPVYMLRKGSLSPAFALRQMARNVAKNALRLPFPEPWVDRRGRVAGNLRALVDLVRGRLDPRRVLELV